MNEETLGWDGLLKGQVMTPQVSVWKARLVFDTGEEKIIYGNFALIK